jgi:hypothetical protein
MELSLSERYIAAKYNGATKEQLIQLRKDAVAELEIVKNRKQEIYDRYPRVHGRFQQSQLDVLDIREGKICAIFDNVSAMI